MGLITLILLLALTILYLEKTIENKPQFLVNISSILHTNIKKFTFWAAIYGVVGIILTPTMAYSGGDVLIRVVANLMVVIMVIPYIFDSYAEKLEEETNQVVKKELNRIVDIIKNQEKIIGYLSAVICLLLFAVVFK